MSSQNPLDPDFNRLLSQKFREDNARPLLPELPRADEELLRVKPKIIDGDVLVPPKKFGEAVTEFIPPYGWLHNDYPCELYAMGYRFRSVSEAFAAAEIEVKPNDPTWDLVTQFQIMRLLLEQKFSNNDDLKWMLLGTKKRHLEHGNRTGDKFWGTDLETPLHPLIADIKDTLYDGENHLGKILMDTREMVRIGMAGEDRVVK